MSMMCAIFLSHFVFAVFWRILVAFGFVFHHDWFCRLYTENDFFIQNRSFLRLKNIELGYTLPERFLSKVGVKALRVYVSGQNLFVWDNLRITHIDPEQNNSYGYPITKNVTLGLNINF